MVDEASMMACSEWLDSHPQTDDYFQYLIVVNKKITQDQSYDVVMKIIIDEANAIDKVNIRHVQNG